MVPVAAWGLVIDLERSPVNDLLIPSRKHFSNGCSFWEPLYHKECHECAIENS